MKHLELAITQLDKKEIPVGSNWGKDVQGYLASVDLYTPNSWCMAFVYWCVRNSGMVNPLVRTGGCLAQWNKIDKKYRKKTPMPGDIFIQDHGKGKGHTGIVEAVQGDKISTIEGNTNDEGSREGYEVCRRVRLISSCVGFIRINEQSKPLV
jgi:hypothetical protein